MLKAFLVGNGVFGCVNCKLSLASKTDHAENAKAYNEYSLAAVVTE